ncbi:SRPBCC family protein [Parapedobacter luteus]|nr:SRPBCC domain-containing protein [Parapedobacter luteus]
MMNPKQLVFEQTYEAPIERVWRALTDKEQLSAWYFDIAGFKAELGFAFTFIGSKGHEQYVHQCRIIEVDPPNKLSYTWAYEGYPGESIVTFELESPAEGHTKLVLTHHGIDTFPAEDDAFSPANFSEGWTFILSESLRNFVQATPFSLGAMIQADRATVWQLIQHPNRQWGDAFGGGALVNDTDWQVGSPVIWTDLEGRIGARGVVTARQEQDTLEVTFYDDIDPVPGAPLGDYIERFRLSANSDGQTGLTVEIAGLPNTYIPSHKEMWEKALQLIKTTAERKSADGPAQTK